MAFHPFRTFQRNQKGCMAGATLLAIISFLFLGVIIQLLGGRSGPGTQIKTYAESRRFGKVTDYELYRLQENHEMLRRFFIVLYQQLADPADEQKMRALFPLQMLVNQMDQARGPEQLINAWLITQYAQEEGLSPDWNDMLKLLKELTGETNETKSYLTDVIYDDTLKSIGMSQQTLEYLLARHIRWQQMLEQLNLSVSVISPATRWDWFQRLFRQVTIEAAAIPVNSFIDQVGEPTTSQLNAFFEEHKGKRRNPMIADSGFIMPMEIAFQYVVVEPSQQLRDTITEEEMLVFYEINKETLFRKQPAARPIMDLPQLPGMPGMPGGGVMPFPTPGRSSFPVPTAPMPQEETADGGRQSAEEAPVEPTPVEEMPIETVPSVEAPTPDTSAIQKVSLRLVSYQTEETQQAGEVAEAESKIPLSEDTKGSEPVAEESEVIDLSVLYRPFDEVKDEIREALAREKAMAGMPIIQAKMREYTDIYHEHFEQGKPIPSVPDLAALAAEQGLELKTVPMGDVYTAMRSELAQGFQERRLIAQLFSRTPLPFEAETFTGSNGPVLYWITEQKPEKKPENIGEVKDIVLKRWKEVEARTLAQKKGEELANEATLSAKPLAEVFASRSEMPVVETEAFSWKTYGNIHPLVALYQGQMPFVSEVREKGVPVGDAEVNNKVIAAPGSDFMEKVFSLQIGETGVVFNQPQSAMYLVRVTSSSPSTDVLWEQFQTTDVRIYRNAGLPEMASAVYESWLAEIQKKVGFRWINKPDAYESERYSSDW